MKQKDESRKVDAEIESIREKDKREMFDVTKKYEMREKEINNDNIQKLKELSIKGIFIYKV